MIHEIVIKPENPYGRFFLSMEAPGDEEPPVPKSNTKVINVKPNNRKKLDFTDGAIEPEDVEEPISDDTENPTTQPEQPVDDTMATNEPDGSVDDNTDTTSSDGMDQTTQNTTDTSMDTTEPAMSDDTNVEQPVDQTASNDTSMDTTEPTVADDANIKPNTKVIDIKPNNRKKLDFTDGAIDPEEPIDGETENPTDPAPEVVSDPENPDGNIDNSGVDTSDNTDFAADGTEQPNGDGNTDISTDDTGDTGEGPDTGEGEDGTDFTDGADGDSDPNGAPIDTSTPEQKKGPGLEYDSTRKYVLFLNYETLINALNNYTTKLENNLTDNLNTNKVLKTAINKLREIKDLCYDYIIMKFEASSYIQSLLFYQNAVIMIQAVFDMLFKMKKYLKTPDEE